jgi:hypothetical protein
MKFDLSDIHVVHVLAAYAVTSVLMLGLIAATVCSYMKSRKQP